MVAPADRKCRKARTLALIENIPQVPQVAADFHLFEIENVEALDGTKHGAPDVPGTRIKMALRVRTPGEPNETFPVWMSAKLGEKANLGGIIRAALGVAPTTPTFDTDRLLGSLFRHMVTHNDGGWPTLVPGTAAPATRVLDESTPPF